MTDNPTYHIFLHEGVDLGRDKVRGGGGRGGGVELSTYIVFRSQSPHVTKIDLVSSFKRPSSSIHTLNF